MKSPKWMRWTVLFLLAVAAIWGLQQRPAPMDDSRLNLDWERRIELSFELARYKLARTVHFLQPSSGEERRYPAYTHRPPWGEKLRNWFPSGKRIPEGAWVTQRSKFWAAGAFPGLLWKMHAHESDPALKKFWANQAKAWAEPLRELPDRQKDVALNSLFAFRPWFEAASGREKARQLETILAGARRLAQPYREGSGTFHPDIGVMGFERKADRTDGRFHWQAFIDHTINVEQLLWAAEHNPNRAEARDWRRQAIRHVKTIGRTFGQHRRPGEAGTWQRGYFDFDPDSPTYGQFLFNEGKQGWGDGTTWSRGQAWAIYGASITYQYARDSEVLAIARAAIDYFLDHLPADFIPAWDFDYALQKNPHTERDSSAAAIAASGMLKLVRALPDSDPDRARYLSAVENILLSLTSPAYLPDREEREMSLLRHGCYHHFASLTPSSLYDNGLIWGDYFFLDALMDYQAETSSRGG